MSSVGCERGWLGGWVLASHILRVVMGRVRIGVPPGLVGNPNPSHGTKCKANVGPKWPRGEEWPGQDILYCRVGERECQEREKQEGQGLKYPSVRFGIIRLVRTLWFMLIGGWEVRKSKLGGIVTLGNWNLRVQQETGTHRSHYCQQCL
jgi:hypothetical protein